MKFMISHKRKSGQKIRRLDANGMLEQLGLKIKNLEQDKTRIEDNSHRNNEKTC